MDLPAFMVQELEIITDQPHPHQVIEHLFYIAKNEYFSSIFVSFGDASHALLSVWNTPLGIVGRVIVSMIYLRNRFIRCDLRKVIRRVIKDIVLNNKI